MDAGHSGHRNAVDNVNAMDTGVALKVNAVNAKNAVDAVDTIYAMDEMSAWTQWM